MVVILRRVVIIYYFNFFGGTSLCVSNFLHILPLLSGKKAILNNTNEVIKTTRDMCLFYFKIMIELEYINIHAMMGVKNLPSKKLWDLEIIMLPKNG